MKIAIFGGTFDPIHIGHLIIAENVLNLFDIDNVIFMPAGLPPHKTDRSITDGRYRLEMVRLAIKDNKYFKVSDWEISKNKKSYTVDTLRYMKKSNKYDKIMFIMGADSLLNIHHWKEPEYILGHALIIVAARPGFNIEKIFTNSKFRPYLENIQFMDSFLLDISSSSIRDCLANRRSVKYLVPDNVISYIQQHNLY